MLNTKLSAFKVSTTDETVEKIIQGMKSDQQTRINLDHELRMRDLETMSRWFWYMQIIQIILLLAIIGLNPTIIKLLFP